MLIPLWFRRRLVFAPEFFFGRSGCFPIVPFGRGRPDFPAELFRGGVVRAERMPQFRSRMIVRVCRLRENMQGEVLPGRLFFEFLICTVHRRFALFGFSGGGISCSVNFAISTLRVADAEGVGKIKSEKTHGSFPISLYGLFAVGRTDFSRIIREFAPSPTVWTDRDGSTRFHKCPACGSSR